MSLYGKNNIKIQYMTTMAEYLRQIVYGLWTQRQQKFINV